MLKYFKISLSFICLLVGTDVVANTYPNVTEANPAVKVLMEQVSTTNLETNIRYLQDLGSRLDKRPENIVAQQWLFEKFGNNNDLDVFINHFLPENMCDSFYNLLGNVVAVQTGTEYPNEYIIVSSHFDTYLNGPTGDTVNLGPGANDNASGTSAVQEIARILSQHTFKRSIIYINFNHEETNMTGSYGFATCCRQNDINILGVFNLDMIGWNPIEKPLAMYCNDRPTIATKFAEYYISVSNLYLPEIPMLPNQDTVHKHTGGSGDDMWFIYKDYPAMYIGDVLGITDGSLEPCYHCPCDTIGIGKNDAGVNSMELVKAYTQATLVAIAELANSDEVGIKDGNSLFDFSISPNPTDGKLNIHTNFVEPYKLIAYTTDGGTAMSVFDFIDGELDLSHLPSGVYFVNVQLGIISISQKLIIR